MTYSPLELAAAFIQAGELQDARNALDQHLVQTPGDDRARRMRIRVLRHLGGEADLRAALSDLQQLASPTADDSALHSLLLEQSGDLSGAVNVMAEAHSRWPENERLTERYIELLIATQQMQAALETARSQPRNWRWLGWEADVLAQMGDDVTATARYGLALAQLEAQFGDESYMAPIKARLLLARAHAYRRLHMFDQADQHYLQAEALIPSDPLIAFLRGLVAFDQDDLPNALLLCQRAYRAANDTLRDQMRDELKRDPRYMPLLTTLEEQTS